ncbi:MAG: hypothetical protein FWF77_04480 [Defluviitaleaceae bacterium]|nr:hypothetical protein [Defluviitaleaceae bacterium]
MLKIYLDNCCYNRPFEERAAYILDFIEEYAVGFVGERRLEEIQMLSGEIIKTGIKKKDATHLACSIIAECDYFITTDIKSPGYDYTEWRENLWEDLTLHELLEKAAKSEKKHGVPKGVAQI